MYKYLPLFLTISATSFAAKNQCTPTPAATCFPAACNCIYCLGPPNELGNSPVRPYTCSGDFIITASGFYWNARQDGMEYAIDNGVAVDDIDFFPSLQQLNNLVDAQYKSPKFKWDFGFKLGLGYNTTCDGWDIGVIWTHFRGKAFSHNESPFNENRSLITLWSAFIGAHTTGFNFATDIRTRWNVDLNFVDLTLGRQYWVSKYLTFRPYVGLRGSWIDQDLEIEYRGGSWSSFFVATVEVQPDFTGEVDLSNDFKGVGLRSGFDLNWNLGCGWSLYQNFAASIIYGRFDIGHDEQIREVASPFTKRPILETTDHFRGSRPILDLELGVQWHSLWCDCQYGLTAILAWEHHLCFHQNQLWRVNRVAGQPNLFPNSTGENVFLQSRGNLSTQGWTLTLRFDF